MLMLLVQAQEIRPDDPIAQKSILRLQPIVAERQEKMKDEMLGLIFAVYCHLPHAALHVLPCQTWLLLNVCVV